MLKKILTLKEYQHFFYIKKIELKNGYLLIKKGKYRHIVSYIGNKNESIILREGYFNLCPQKLIYIEGFLLDPIIPQKQMKTFYTQSVSHIELTMKEDGKNASSWNNDFPKEIKFLNIKKEVILIIKFNEFGFPIEIMDELGNIILEDEDRKKLNTKEEISVYIEDLKKYIKEYKKQMKTYEK